MKTLCVVPARGGSKRFRNKNYAMLGGKPLFMWAIDRTLNVFDAVVFSTDSQYIRKLAKEKYGDRIIYHNRDKKLAGDQSKVIDTVVDIATKYSSYDQVYLSLPTCPLMSEEQVIRTRNLLQSSNDDGIITITDCEFPPVLSLEIDYLHLKDWHESKPWQDGNSRSQAHKPLYRPNGGLYGMNYEHFMQVKNFYIGDIGYFYMDRKYSVDIDTPYDMVVAEAALAELRKNS